MSSVHVRRAAVVLWGEQDWAPLAGLNEATVLLLAAVSVAEPLPGPESMVWAVLYADAAISNAAHAALLARASDWLELVRITPESGDVEATLAVWDDWRQAQGLPSWVDEKATKATGKRRWSESAPRALAETPELAAWLAAWLDDDTEAHLPALRDRVKTMWEARTIECPQCIEDRGRFPLLRPRVEACSCCDGLGRVSAPAPISIPHDLRRHLRPVT